MIALGVVVFYNYLVHVQRQREGEAKDRPPFLHRAESDLILIERDGREVRLDELRGKVILASWVFTRCPRGCPGVIAKMKQIAEEYKDRIDLHCIAFALDPEDTPEMMAGFAERLGIEKKDPWWFVNGDPKQVQRFMERQLKFRPVQIMPEEDRLTPDDKFMHDLRVAVIDHRGNVRRLADLVNVDPEVATFWDVQIRKDLDYILKEKDQETKKP